MARRLAKTVLLTDPKTGERHVLRAGSSVNKKLAALISNPGVWEGADDGDDEQTEAPAEAAAPQPAPDEQEAPAPAAADTNAQGSQA